MRTSTETPTEPTKEPSTESKQWLAAWARATLLFPSCTGPTGAIALWRTLAQERRR